MLHHRTGSSRHDPAAAGPRAAAADSAVASFNHNLSLVQVEREPGTIHVAWPTTTRLKDTSDRPVLNVMDRDPQRSRRCRWHPTGATITGGSPRADCKPSSSWPDPPQRSCEGRSLAGLAPHAPGMRCRPWKVDDGVTEATRPQRGTHPAEGASCRGSHGSLYLLVTPRLGPSGTATTSGGWVAVSPNWRIVRSSYA